MQTETTSNSLFIEDKEAHFGVNSASSPLEKSSSAGDKDTFSPDREPSGETTVDDRIIAQQIAELYQANGVSPRKLAARIASVANLHAKSARRKLDGVTAFTTSELGVILDDLGFEYAGIYGFRKKAAEGDGSNKQFHASVEMDGELRSCLVTIRSDRRPVPAGTGKVLIESSPGEYSIVSKDKVPHGVQGHLIESMEFKEPYSYEGSGAYLGIFDDDESAAETIAAGLHRAGFKTIPLTSQTALNKALKSRHFDALLLNWANWCEWDPVEVGDRIRKSFPNIPIIFNAGFEDEENPALILAAESCNAMILPQLLGTQGITRYILRELKRTPA